MEHCYEIGKVNLKHNLKYHLLVAAGVLGCSPLLLGIRNLDMSQTAQVLEMYTAIIGIILLVPVFFPEQEKNIRDLQASKYMSVWKVQIVRLLESLLFLAVYIGCYLLVLKRGGCDFPAASYFWGTMAEAGFLGGIGILAYVLSDTVAIGYMVPVMYFAANFGGSKYLGKYYLFGMMYGSYEEKIWLGVTGLICMVVAVVWRQRRQ